MKYFESRPGGGVSAVARTMTTVLVAVASVLVMALVGCASPSGIDASAKLAAPPTLGADATATVAPVAADWWRGFEDPVLDDLIARATSGNPSLRIAAARAARAAANSAAADANRAPQLTGQIDATRQRFTENGLYPPPLAGATLNSATVQLNGSWELDFFGRNRALLEAAIGAERAAVADADAARILLAVNVARTYVQLARLVEQRDVLQRALAQREETYSLTNQRVSAGLDTAVELRQSEGAAARDAPADRSHRRADRAHSPRARRAPRRAAAALRDARAELSSLRPVAIPAVVPADLVGRRADIVAARWRVEAADRRRRRAARAVLSQRQPDRVRRLVEPRPRASDRYRQRAVRHRPGDSPADLRRRAPARGPARPHRRSRRRGRELQRHVGRGDPRRCRPDQLDAIGRSPAARAGRGAGISRSGVRPGDRSATAPASAAISPCSTAETNVIAQRRLSTDLRARAIDSQMLLVRALGGGYAPAAETRALASADAPR